MVDKKVDNTVKDLQLTPVEAEILQLLTEEFLTVKQITLRRNCTRQAVHKILKILKKKGAYNIGLTKVDKGRGTCQPSDKIRLHGEEFNIKILYKDRHYNKLLERSNVFYLDGNTIKLYRGSLEVYSGQSFYGKTAQEATRKSILYWRHFFAQLEHKTKAILMKPQSRNIRLVNAHYAYTGSEICEKSIEEGHRIKIFAEEDGKLAFITDDSFGFKEDETIHPKTAKPDREAIDKQVNDWRLNNPPTLSQLSTMVYKNAENLDHYAIHLKSHVESVKLLASSVQELTQVIKELKGGVK